ncbi:MAG: apolipoprotein N-acyltransferase, partial [Desulforhopalus sp.]
IIVVGKYGGLSWYFSSLALLGLASYMSLYFVLFCVGARLVIQVFSPVAVLWLLPVLWVGLDWLKGVLFTGFPWMDLGYSLYETPVLLQVADLVGHHGVTFLIVFINSLLFLLLTAKQSLRGWAALLLPAVCLFLGAGYYSLMRFEAITSEATSAGWPSLRVGVVQGNIDQSIKWSPAQQKATVANYLVQTRKLADTEGKILVVWPETALPFYPPSSDLMESLYQEVKRLNVAILTGAPWFEVVDPQKRVVNFFNSAILLRPDGLPGGRYDKTHLVPFGEYVPLKKYLPFLAPLVVAVGDFSAGKIDTPLVWQQARAGILICFESVFPELSRQWMLNGANVLINLTNDAWYGKSSAPHHSLAMSVLRAVETRRSLVRSANTGISAFIRPNGLISDRSEIFVTWQGAAEVALLEGLTVWVRYGYLFGPACLAAGIMGLLAAGRQKRKDMSGLIIPK